MKICLISDTHQEFNHYDHYIDLLKKEINGDDSIVILAAGDIDEGIIGMSALADNFPFNKIIYIPGNHEYYCNSIDKIEKEAIEQFYRSEKYPNFIFAESNYIILDNGKTYSITTNINWPDITKSQYKNQITRGINDFRLIESSFDNLEEYFAIEKSIFHSNLRARDYSADVNILMTHFIPHVAGIHPIWQNSSLNDYFCSPIPEDLLNKFDYCFFGHTHNSIDTMVNNTRIISNPRGYPTEYNVNWKPLILEI